MRALCGDRPRIARRLTEERPEFQRLMSDGVFFDREPDFESRWGAGVGGRGEAFAKAAGPGEEVNHRNRSTCGHRAPITKHGYKPDAPGVDGGRCAGPGGG